MHRRKFLQQTMTATGALVLLRREIALTDEERRAAQLIREYDQQGIHRTGTAVDERSARWLAEQVRRCGLTSALDPFTLSRVDPRACYLQISGRRIEGLPVFDGSFTGAGGVRGNFGPLDSEAEIGLTEFPPGAEYVPAYAKMRRETRHRA